MPVTVAGLEPFPFALLAEFATAVLMILAVNNHSFFHCLSPNASNGGWTRTFEPLDGKGNVLPLCQLCRL
jgi:hypothetical protein